MVHVPSMTRSVTMAQLAGAPKDVALFPHYGDAVSRRQWDAEIRPWLDCALEHMPVSAYLADPAFLPHVDAIARLVQPAALSSLCSRAPTVALGVAVTSEAERPTQMEALQVLETCDAADDRVVLASTMTLPTLAAMGAEQTRAAVEQLERMKQEGQILAYALVRERPLAQCDDCLQLLMALPVDKDIDHMAFPPLQVGG